jgi:hypothetical protein
VRSRPGVVGGRELGPWARVVPVELLAGPGACGDVEGPDVFVCVARVGAMGVCGAERESLTHAVH